MLVKVKGTPLADNDDVDAFDFIRTIAVARIMMPTSYVRFPAALAGLPVAAIIRRDLLLFRLSPQCRLNRL
ncbi:hypothetical protein [Escherichia coli]|uniref:hypothetical protein n=1 Tax=Escherichia coli TaxID=562 RepID=UPI003D81C33A